MGGGVEQSLNTCHYEAFLRHPETDSRHSEALAEESTCHENNKIERHPEFISGSVPFAQLSNKLFQERNKNINSYFMFISFLFLRRKRKEMNQRKEKGRQLKNTVNF